MRAFLVAAVAALVLAAALPSLAKEGKGQGESPTGQPSGPAGTPTTTQQAQEERGRGQDGQATKTATKTMDARDGHEAHGKPAPANGTGSTGPGSKARDAEAKGEGPRSEDNATRGKPAANATEAKGQGKGKPLFGSPTFANGTLAGTFVHLAFDDATSRVSDYAVGNGSGAPTPFIDAVELAPATASDAKLSHTALRAKSGVVHIDAHDEPLGSVYWDAKGDATLTFTLANGTTASRAGASEAVLSSGKWHAHIVAKGANVTVANGTVTVAVSQGDRVALRAHPPGMGATLHTENKLLSHGKLGAVARIGTAGSDVQDLGVNVTAHKVTNETVELTIGSEEHEGKTVMLVLDSLDGSRPEDVAIQLGDETMEPSADGTPEAGEFNVASSSEGLVVEMNVTHFSSYSVTISQAPKPASQGGAESSTPGVGLVALVGVVAIAVAARRGR